MAVKSPTITVVDEAWQRDKGAILGLTYIPDYSVP